MSRSACLVLFYTVCLRFSNGDRWKGSSEDSLPIWRTRTTSRSSWSASFRRFSRLRTARTSYSRRISNTSELIGSQPRPSRENCSAYVGASAVIANGNRSSFWVNTAIRCRSSSTSEPTAERQSDTFSLNQLIAARDVTRNEYVSEELGGREVGDLFRVARLLVQCLVFSLEVVQALMPCDWRTYCSMKFII